MCGKLAASTPNRLFWGPLAAPDGPAGFLHGFMTWMSNSETRCSNGAAIHQYYADRDMRRLFWNADGEFLIVLQLSRLTIDTELGRFSMAPPQVALIPRGVRFRVGRPAGQARGCIRENHRAMPRLPDIGPTDAIGLATTRDFPTPVAWNEDRDDTTDVVWKFMDRLWSMTLDHCLLDVVAWHGWRTVRIKRAAIA